MPHKRYDIADTIQSFLSSRYNGTEELASSLNVVMFKIKNDAKNRRLRELPVCLIKNGAVETNYMVHVLFYWERLQDFTAAQMIEIRARANDDSRCMRNHKRQFLVCVTF